MNTNIEKDNLGDNMSITNGKDRFNVKRLIAMEFIYVVGISICCFLIHEFGNYCNRQYKAEIERANKTLDGLPQRQLLWYKLRKHKLYNSNYKRFKEDYKFSEDQILLFKLVTNNGLFTMDFMDFRVKYFKKEAVLDDSYYLFYDDYRLGDEYIQNNDKEFWNDLRKKQERFKILLKNDSIFKVLYSRFVLTGFRGSVERFKTLLFEPDQEGISTSEVDKLEEIINQEIPQYQKIADYVILLILLLFYPLRYLIMGLKWSFRQIGTVKS